MAECYYPSLVLNLQIRFEEGLEGLPSTPVSAKELADKGGAGASTSKEPVILKPGKDNLSQLLGIVPKSCAVELPGYRQAGTFSFELDFRDLPLDPRVIRAMGVAIHLDTVTAKDWAAGIEEKPEGRRKSILQATPENVLLVGTADSIDAEYNDRGMTVRVEGRDLRGIMLDTAVPSEMLAKIDLKKPIDQVVKQIVNDLMPMGQGIQVQVLADEWPGGTIPAPFVEGDATRIMMSADGQKARANAKGDANQLKFWDLITQYCFVVGAIPYFQGSILRVRPSRSLYDAARQEKAFDPAIPTPFKDRMKREVKSPLVDKSEKFAYRRLVFGRDIQTLKFERKLGGVKTPTILCVSVDTSSSERGVGRLIEGQWPEEGNVTATSVGASGDGAQVEVMRIPVPGVKSADRLKEIARDLFQEVGRQELGGSCTSKDLSSFGGGNDDADLVKLRPGDPIEFRVVASDFRSFPPPISELTEHQGRSSEEEVKALTDRLGDENLARVLVQSARGEIAQLQRTFRVANVKFDWNKDSGVGVAFDFQNYVEARHTKD